jgi:NTE family protein
MKRIGISLRGGGARTTAYLGVLRFLEENNIPISAFLGSSGGSVIAGTYAAGMSIEDTIQYMSIHHLSRNRSIAANIHGHMWDSKKMLQWAKDLVGDRTIEGLNIPTFIQVTNLSTLKNEIIEDGLLAFWSNASCCFPFLESPYIFNGEMYGDGDLTSGYDSKFLRSKGCDYVIGLSIKGEEKLDPGITSRFKSLIYAPRQRVMDLDMEIDRPDLIIEIDLPEIGRLELHKAGRGMVVGYKSMSQYSEQLFKDLGL